MKRMLGKIAVLLALVLVLSPFGALAPLVTQASAAEAADNPLDFSLPYGHRAVLSPSDLLSLLLDSLSSSREPDAIELQYLRDYYPNDLFYSDALSADLFSVEPTAEGLTVTARPYSYTGQNGRTVTYLPLSATCNGTTRELTRNGDGFCALFADAEEATVTVSYTGSVTLDKAEANRLLTFAFSEATAAIASNKALVDYSAALAEYRLYLRALEDYEAALGQYQAYVATEALYQEACAEYEKNQALWIEYNKKKQAYDTYAAAYAQYKSDLAQFKLDYAAYEASAADRVAYLNNISAIRTAMVAMESLFIKPTKTGSLFKALQNEELVLMFEKYQGILVSNFGVAEQDIRLIRQYSDELNELLRGYSDARDSSERDAFEYYQTHYAEIDELFNYLYDKMTAIMTPTIYNLMCGKLELEYGKELGSYKKWRIKNVLAHIYRICLCLDDDRSAETTWAFFDDEGYPHTYYFSDLLEQSLIITDTGASDPTGLTWIDPVEVPDPPTQPTEPVAVEQPVAPPKLEEPQKPTAVEQPTQPTPIAEPTVPETVDHALMLRTKDIQAALAASLLPQRAELTDDPTLSLPTVTVIRTLRPHDTAPTVTVYDKDGTELTHSSPSEALPTLPSYSDSATTYEFLGWSTSPTAPVAVPENPTESLCLYPLYQAAPRTYTVTFAGGSITPIRVSYGETPVYDGTLPTKESDEEYDYTFSTWSPALRPTRGDQTYEAQFTSAKRQYTVLFDLGNQQFLRRYEWQELPVCPVTPTDYVDGTVLYEFIGWDRAFGAVSGDARYTAEYTETVLASLPKQTSGTLTLSKTATGYLLQGSGNTLQLSGLIRLAQAEGQRIHLFFEDLDLSVSFDSKTIRDLKKNAADSVTVQTEQTDNTTVVSVRFYNAAGKQVNPDGDLHLRLPHGFENDRHISVRADYDAGYYADKIPATSADGYTGLIVDPDARYTLSKRYALSVVCGENGTVVLEDSLYYAGERPKLTVHPNTEYRLGTVTVLNTETGESYSPDSLSDWTMPAFDAQITVEFVPITYTVTFVYHGQCVEQTYRLGETVEVPEIPTSFEEDGFFYTFIGWSSPVTIVTGDAVYTAKYYSVRIEEKTDDGEGGAWSRILLKFGVPAAIALVAVAAAITVPIIIINRKAPKKRKKGGQEARSAPRKERP